MCFPKVAKLDKTW